MIASCDHELLHQGNNQTSRQSSDKSSFAAGCGDQHATSVRSPDMSATIIRNGRVIDPANKRDEVADLYIADGKIVGVQIRNSKSEIRN